MTTWRAFFASNLFTHGLRDFERETIRTDRKKPWPDFFMLQSSFTRKLFFGLTLVFIGKYDVILKTRRTCQPYLRVKNCDGVEHESMNSLFILCWSYFDIKLAKSVSWWRGQRWTHSTQVNFMHSVVKKKGFHVKSETNVTTFETKYPCINSHF